MNPSKDFEEFFELLNRNEARYGEQEIYVIGKQELIINKSSMGREQDKLDVKNLRKAGK
jgi:hypothetical protein